MPSVLFVCTANRFRSPLAAAFFRKALTDSAVTGTWDVDSAGTWTVPGLPVLPEVSLIARKYGLDLTWHRSKPVTEALLAAHDLILVMEAGHKEALQIEFPSLSDHIYLLSHVVERGSYDITDAFGSEQEVVAIISEMNTLIQRGLHHICLLATALHNQQNRVK